MSNNQEEKEAVELAPLTPRRPANLVPLDLPTIDTTSIRRANLGGSQSMPPSPINQPATATTTGISSRLSMTMAHTTNAVQSGRMTKLPHYGRLRSVTARVLRMMDPRTFANRRNNNQEESNNDDEGNAAGMLGRSVVDTVRHASHIGRRRRYSHGSMPTSTPVSRVNSRDRLTSTFPRRSLDFNRRVRNSLMIARQPSHGAGSHPGLSPVDGMSPGSRPPTLAHQQTHDDSIIAIPMPGFFLDPQSDDWTGGHSFRQRMRFPDEVISVPASLTKRVHYEVSYDYPKNVISTARYNVLTFLPAQLAAQFSKVANVYFLFIVILQQVPGWSTTGKWSTLLPLSVFVSLSIAHEGFDDLRRHRMDHAENSQKTRVLKVKVHDKERLSFRFREFRHRGSQSIHSFRMRSSQSIHDIGRNTVDSVKRWAMDAVSIGTTVRQAVVTKIAEKRRKKRELEDSDDEEEQPVVVEENGEENLEDSPESNISEAGRVESILRSKIINRGVRSIKSWRSNTLRTPVLAQSALDSEDDEEAAPVRRGPTVAFNDVVEEMSYNADNDDDGDEEEPPVNPLPENMSCRWKKKRWENVQIGDLLMIHKDDWIPADCVVIASTGFDGTCFVETAALDGETTLKQKQALEVTNSEIQTAEQLAAFSAFTYVEPASAELYSFEGFMEIKGTKYPLTPNQLLLRGSVLRNTAYVFAQVVYAGEHTRLRLNATRNVRTKAPQIQRITNRIVIIVFILLISLCLIWAGLGIDWNHKHRHSAWYLWGDLTSAAALIFGYIITMNALIPISLYVTLEAVKIFQCWFIQQDIDMYYPVTDIRAEARTTAINEDLGMVRYVFSDKTGTLTDNIMKMRALMCAGVSYLHEDLDRLSPIPTKKQKEKKKKPLHRRQLSMPAPISLPVAEKTPTLQQFAVTRAAAHHVRGLSTSSALPPQTSSPLSKSEFQLEDDELPSTLEDDDPLLHTPAAEDAPQSDLLKLPSSRTIMNSNWNVRHRSEWFLRTIALCHVVQPDRDPLTGRITGYQATSPDEKALVAAAAELGFVMNNRSGPLVQLRVVATERMRDFNQSLREDQGGEDSFDKGVPAPHPTDRLGNYEVLDVLEFSSARKRMSVVLKCPDGRIVVMMKGADSAIWPRLLDTNKLEGLTEQARVVRKLSNPSMAYLHSQSSSVASMPDLLPAFATPHSPFRPSKHKRVMSDASEASSFMTDTEGTVEVPESFIQPSRQDEESDRERALEALHQFSTEGLRTLVYAHKELSSEEYEAWHARYAAATTALVNRQQQIESVCEEIEQGFVLTGVSAIEDRLQEGVPETIFKLRRAGIRVWMLTGDKVETAINIAKSCRLIDTEAKETTSIEDISGMQLLLLQGVSEENELDSVLERTLDRAYRLQESVDERFERTSRWQKLRRGLKLFGRGKRQRKPRNITPTTLRTTDGGTQEMPLRSSGASQSSDGTKAQPPGKKDESSPGEPPASLAVVVDGETLATLEGSPKLLDKFLTLGTLCDAVICSRVSPSQKALIVHKMRVRCEAGRGSVKSSQLDKPAVRPWWRRNPFKDLLTHDNDRYMVTLAIGDGGNDIAMIQESHVGIGIAGQEGLQASRAADFSIAQFRFLQKLLLVHGRWSYVRVSMFIMNTFYKCMAFYTCQLIYQFFTGYSGTSLFESWTLSMYNTLFAIAPVMIIGIFEQDLQPTTLLKFPELYRDMGPQNHLFTVPIFFRRVIITGVGHAVIASLLPMAADLMLGKDISSSDMYITGLVTYCIVVLVISLKIAYLDSRRWIMLSHWSVILTMAVWFGWNGVLCHVYPNSPSTGYVVLGAFTTVMQRGSFWFQWVIFSAVAILFNVIVDLIVLVRDPVEHRITMWIDYERRQEKMAIREKRQERRQMYGGQRCWRIWWVGDLIRRGWINVRQLISKK